MWFLYEENRFKCQSDREQSAMVHSEIPSNHSSSKGCGGLTDTDFGEVEKFSIPHIHLHTPHNLAQVLANN